MNDAELILVAGALLAAGIGASLAAGRMRLPGLVLFLALGMAIGSDGTGWIDFSDYELGPHDRRHRARADPLRNGGVEGPAIRLWTSPSPPG